MELRIGSADLAAVRALVEERRRLKRRPVCTLDLRSDSMERCRKIQRALRFRRYYPIEEGMPYIELMFPEGFTAEDFTPESCTPHEQQAMVKSDHRQQATAQNSEHKTGAMSPTEHRFYDDLLTDEGFLPGD